MKMEWFAGIPRWRANDAREAEDMKQMSDAGVTVDELRDDLHTLLEWGQGVLKGLPDRWPLMPEELVRIGERHGPFAERIPRRELDRRRAKALTRIREKAWDRDR